MEKVIYNEKIKIGNAFLYTYIMYILFVVVTEWVNFVSYETRGRNFGMGIAELISVIVITVLSWFIKNEIQVGKIIIDWWWMTGIVMILALGIMKSAFPDGGFDTFNYHLIAQNPKFENYFVEDLGYGNFQVWGFRLGDRLFYYFRYLLGYRFGTLLNTFVFIICFIQIYDLLDILYVSVKKGSVIRRFVCNKLLWSMAILFSMDSLMMYGSYYVDFMAMPIVLEMLRLIIFDYNKKVSMKEIAWFALLNGLCIGMKLTNIVYVIPCVLIYLIIHIKSLKPLYWIAAISAGLLPFAEYVVFNWICTGNPVFPYFNSLFKSSYFSSVNWKDGRWGGTTLMEKLMWIWSLVFNPQYRKSEIWDEWNGILIIGLVGTIITFIYYFVRKLQINKQYLVLALIAIISALIWSVTTGYSRYYMIGRVFWGLLAYYFVVSVVNEKKFVGNIVAFACLCIAVSHTIFNLTINLSGKNWSWQAWTWEGFKEQIELAFHDNDIGKYYGCRADLFVVTDQTSMGVAELIDGDVFTINMNYLGNIDLLDPRRIVEEKIDIADLAYDIHGRAFTDIYDYVERLNINLLYATNMESIDLSVGTYQMITVENLNGRENTVWTSKEGILELDVAEIQGRRQLKFMGGRMYDCPVEKIKLVVSLSDGVEERQAASVWLDNVSIENYDIPLDIDEKENVIKITAYYESGSVVETEQINGAFCMNFAIE